MVIDFFMKMLQMKNLEHTHLLLQKVLIKIILNRFNLSYCYLLFKEQLKEIKKSTMAGLICNNFDVKTIQPNAFYTKDFDQ